MVEHAPHPVYMGAERGIGYGGIGFYIKFKGERQLIELCCQSLQAQGISIPPYQQYLVFCTRARLMHLAAPKAPIDGKCFITLLSHGTMHI